MIAIPQPISYATGLECSVCKKRYSITHLNSFATCCNKPLVVRYEYELSFLKEDLLLREKNMWRYFEMLPVFERRHIISLGEGMTPVLPLDKMAARYEFTDLWMKDESLNPTGSFKARGMSMAISKANELGVKRCIIPSAGNAGVAAAAYCAKAGIECTVVMPRHTAKVFQQECELYGADVILVDGLISDCANKAAEMKQLDAYYDLSTLKEPYRLEGKKTMGYEIAEQFNWHLPDVILYPTGGGTGLIGMWKAFHEMLQMHWIEGSLPKMIAVQSMNCDPVVRAFNNGKSWKENFHPQPSIAAGLTVPYPFGMDMILDVLHSSDGIAITVNEKEIVDGLKEIAKAEGLLISAEGASLWKALLSLRKTGIVNAADKILLLNTGMNKDPENIF